VSAPVPNLERRALSGSFANVASIVAILLQNLALVPVLLHRWTPETYGIWITLLAVQSLLFTINYGQEAYVGYEAARLVHQDKAALPGLIGAGIFIGIVIIVFEVALVVGLGLTHFTGLFSVGPALDEGWKPLAVVIGCWGGFGSAANILIRVGYALGYYSRFTFLSVLYRVITAVAIGVAALLGGGLWSAALAYGVATLVTQALLMVSAIRVIRNYDIAVGRPRLGVVGGIVTKSAVISGTSLLDAFSNNGLLTIISSMLSPAVVPSFSTLRTIANTANQGVGIIMHPLDPDMIRYHAKKELVKLYEVFGVCWTVAGSVINFGICSLPLFIEPLYRAWTCGKLPFNFPLFSLLVVSVAVRTLGHPALAFLQATNDVSAQARISAARAVLVVSLSLVLIRPFGLVGVGSALVISEAIGAALLPIWHAMRAFSGGDIPFPVGRMLVAIVSVVLVGVTFAILCVRPDLKLVVCAASCSGVAALGIFQWSMLLGETRSRLLSLVPVPGLAR